MSSLTIRRIYCRLITHWPALVSSPTRCRRCGEMIEWDDRGGWRYHDTRAVHRHRDTKLAYEGALRDVRALALDEYNPCHDRVRDWIDDRLPSMQKTHRGNPAALIDLERAQARKRHVLARKRKAARR